jgi:hypothetical protein
MNPCIPGEPVSINTVEVPTTLAEQKFTIINIEPHQGAPTFREDIFRMIRKRVINDKRCFVVISGDWTDDDRPSTRDRRRHFGDGRPEILEKDDKREMDWLDREVAPRYEAFSDRIIGVVDGDHYRILGQHTSAQHLCRRLKIPNAYLGEREGYARLMFRANTNNLLVYNVLVRHGIGGAGSSGASVNAMEKQGAGWDFDLHCGGHNHKNHGHVQAWCKGPNRIGTDVVWAFRAHLRASSLLGRAKYVTREEYAPQTNGWTECEITIGKTMAHSSMAVKMVKASSVAVI